MNIFASSRSPEESASRLWLNPVRARKMITESMQLLSCVQDHYKKYPHIKTMYGTRYRNKVSIIKHPCANWLYESEQHVVWLIRHVAELYKIYTTHPSSNAGFSNVPRNLALLKTQFTEEPNLETIQFVNCTYKTKPIYINFKWVKDVNEAYRLYLSAQGA